MNSQVAVIQINSSAQPDANRARVAKLVANAAGQGAGLAVLPEMWLSMGNSVQLEATLDPATQADTLKFMCELARQHSIWLVGGSIPWHEVQQNKTVRSQDDNAKPYARCWVIDANGEPVAYYDKIHLFDVEVADGVGQYCESAVYAAGNEPVTLQTPFGILGLAICYDLRFPELFRKLWQAGAELIAVPSAFTKVTGSAHWSSLLYARAIENSCYILAPNQTGRHADGRQTWGHSMIVGPWGDELACLNSGEGVLMAEIDRQKIASIRTRMPCHRHQKLKF